MKKAVVVAFGVVGGVTLLAVGGAITWGVTSGSHAIAGSATSSTGEAAAPTSVDCSLNNSPLYGCSSPYVSSTPALPSALTRQPEAADFTIDLKVASKQCFGSAGCNVVVEPAIDYIGASTITSGYECDLTYSVSGDESGEVVETACNTGGS